MQRFNLQRSDSSLPTPQTGPARRSPSPTHLQPPGKELSLFPGRQLSLTHSSPGEVLAPDTLPWRNYFGEVEFFLSSTIKAPSPDFLLPHTQYSPKQSENGLADRRWEGRNWQLCPKEEPARWRGVWAVPQADCGWQGHCRRDGAPSDPGSQEPFIA